jgi:hypothetical protein
MPVLFQLIVPSLLGADTRVAGTHRRLIDERQQILLTAHEWEQLFARARGRAPSVPPTVLTFELWLKPISELPQYNFRTERPKPAAEAFSAAGSGSGR